MLGKYSKSSTNKKLKERFEIGQIVNTFGIKGEVKVKPFTAYMERFEEFENVIIKKNNEEKEYKIQNVKYQKNVVILKLEGIDRIEEAEKLRNAYIEITREMAGELEEGTYYIADLLNLEVYTDEGALLGKVDDIYNNGSSDIYVIKNEIGKQILLPAIEEVIKKVDLQENKIIVHILDGLI